MKDLRGFWGLLAAYWLSYRWREAWTLTVIVFAITTLLSKAGVWTATASADFLAALAGFHRAEDGVDPGQVVLMAAAAYLAIFVARSAGTALRHFVSATLHRRARAWLVDRFDREILADERTALDLMSDRSDAGGAPRLPDAIDQRIDECSNGLYAGIIGLAMGLWGAIASSLVRIMPPRGPRSVLCVVVVTTWACGNGEGCAPPATRPAKWAMSTMK